MNTGPGAGVGRGVGRVPTTKVVRNSHKPFKDLPFEILTYAKLCTNISPGIRENPYTVGSGYFWTISAEFLVVAVPSSELSPAFLLEAVTARFRGKCQAVTLQQ